jgi:hypothetical protein
MYALNHPEPTPNGDCKKIVHAILEVSTTVWFEI